MVYFTITWWFCKVRMINNEGKKKRKNNLPLPRIAVNGNSGLPSLSPPITEDRRFISTLNDIFSATRTEDTIFVILSIFCLVKNQRTSRLKGGPVKASISLLNLFKEGVSKENSAAFTSNQNKKKGELLHCPFHLSFVSIPHLFDWESSQVGWGIDL